MYERTIYAHFIRVLAHLITKAKAHMCAYEGVRHSFVRIFKLNFL